MAESPSVPHALSLKILRLSRPSLVTSAPLCPPVEQPEPWSQAARGLSFVPSRPRPLQDLAQSDLLALPPFFGNIYLGETFSSFVSVNNESFGHVADVSIKAELQTTSQRFTLVDTQTSGAPNSSGAPTASFAPTTVGNNASTQAKGWSLEPGQSAEFALHHEIKELGIHILVCSVHYSSSSAPTDRKFFRKFYKFQVMNPLSVKTKVNSLPDGRVFLETQIQNITAGPIHLERMKFDPAEVFSFVDLNKTDLAPPGKCSVPLSKLPSTSVPHTRSDSSGMEMKKQGSIGSLFSTKSDKLSEQTKLNSIFGSYMQPMDTRQYLFLLVPLPKMDETRVKTFPGLGKLDIIWSFQLGQYGRLQTSQLSRKIPVLEPFVVSVTRQPAIIETEAPFTLSCRIRNNLASESLRLCVSLEKKRMTKILPLGSSELSLGNVKGDSFIDFDLDFFPLYPGLHKIPGLKIVDRISGTVMELESLADVFVIQGIPGGEEVVR